MLGLKNHCFKWWMYACIQNVGSISLPCSPHIHLERFTRTLRGRVRHFRDLLIQFQQVICTGRVSCTMWWISCSFEYHERMQHWKFFTIPAGLGHSLYVQKCRARRHLLPDVGPFTLELVPYSLKDVYLALTGKISAKMVCLLHNFPFQEKFGPSYLCLSTQQFQISATESPLIHPDLTNSGVTTIPWFCRYTARGFLGKPMTNIVTNETSKLQETPATICSWSRVQPLNVHPQHLQQITLTVQTREPSLVCS